MTVKQLVDKLSKLDQDRDIFLTRDDVICYEPNVSTMNVERKVISFQERQSLKHKFKCRKKTVFLVSYSVCDPAAYLLE